MAYRAFSIDMYPMKKTGEVKTKLFISKGMDIEKAKDGQENMDHAYYWEYI